MPFESQFGIWIDPSSLLDSKTPPMSPEAYENGVRTILMKISNSKVGKAVLNTIRWHHRVVRIVPNVIDPSQCAKADADEVDLKQFQLNKAINLVNTIGGTPPLLTGEDQLYPGHVRQGRRLPEVLRTTFSVHSVRRRGSI